MSLHLPKNGDVKNVYWNWVETLNTNGENSFWNASSDKIPWLKLKMNQKRKKIRIRPTRKYFISNFSSFLILQQVIFIIYASLNVATFLPPSSHMQPTSSLLDSEVSYNLMDSTLSIAVSELLHNISTSSSSSSTGSNNHDFHPWTHKPGLKSLPKWATIDILADLNVAQVLDRVIIPERGATYIVSTVATLD